MWVGKTFLASIFSTFMRAVSFHRVWVDKVGNSVGRFLIFWEEWVDEVLINERQTVWVGGETSGKVSPHQSVG